jgi:DNA topoisomerase-2
MLSTEEGEIVSLEDREHLLLRPDTLCGSTKNAEHVCHVYVQHALNVPYVRGAGEEEEGVAKALSAAPSPQSLVAQYTVVKRTLVYAPALKNLFQEILTNALDRQFRDEKMKKIEVWIDCAEAGGPGWIRIRNDGQGVPVVFDEGRAAWKPTIAFSHFRSGTNFADDGVRWTAGRNGYGCKATNVFSSVFTVSTADPRAALTFTQTFDTNMAHASEPVVRPLKTKKGFTDVSFLLDFARLGGGDGMSADVRTMLEATTIDASACTARRVTLSLNGKVLEVKTLRDFAGVFAPAAFPAVALDVVKNEAHNVNSWEICAVAASDACSEDNCLGFVNSLQCSQGTHVNLGFARITTAVEECMRTRLKKADFTLAVSVVRRHVFLVVKLLVDSPEFSSQTKEKLTTPASRFDFKWQPSVAFMKQLAATGVLNRIHEEVVDKELAAARRLMGSQPKTSGARRVVIADKYDAATNVSKSGSRCSLLVTEGDSARALAVAGLAVVGRANFGIFALKGKPLNVRNATVESISKNKEVTTLINILGLTLHKVYTSLDGLSYKKLVIFSDQDPDGAHIGGLIINVIHALFPSILAVDPSYVQRFPTPLVRATSKTAVRCFYASAHYEEWWRSVEPSVQATYTVKYFKGLGTSTSALAREYFSAYKEHLVDIVWNAASDALMVQMFQTDNAAARRALLTTHFNPASYVDYTAPSVTLHDFIHKEVLPYSNYSNERNIPNVLDGLKPVQRKALFTLLSKNVTSDVKVAQVAAQIASCTMYHHGEQSLVEAVIGMAQDHVGVSNINLFRPEGQFGSRLDPPSVHSAARYIFTGLDSVTRALFPKLDDDVLVYKEDEGLSIEPVVFAPVIPMALVNGAFGIGTGWATSVPMYNPDDLIRLCRLFAAGDDAGVLAGAAALTPWYCGFRGTIEFIEAKGVYRTRGCMTVSEDCSRIHITELPVGVWTHSFVEDLEKFINAARSGGSGSGSSGKDKEEKKRKRTNSSGAGIVTSIEKLWTDSTVDMVLHCDKEKVSALMGEGLAASALWSVLGMQNEIRTSNMHLHDEDGKLRHYESVGEIVREHATFRLALYGRRKQNMLVKLEAEKKVQCNKLRFVSEVIAGTICIHLFRDEDALKSELVSKSYDTLLASADHPRAPDFGYLMNMTLRSLTHARVATLREDIRGLEERLVQLQAQSAADLWCADLDALERELVAFRAKKTKRYSATVAATSSTARPTKHRIKKQKVVVAGANI